MSRLEKAMTVVWMAVSFISAYAAVRDASIADAVAVVAGAWVLGYWRGHQVARIEGMSTSRCHTRNT